MKRPLYSLLALCVLLFPSGACERATPVAPESATLSITADPLRIDPFGESEITVIGRKSDGSPVNPGTEVILTTTLGSVDRVVLVDERGVAQAKLVGDGTIGLATVEASSGAAAAVTVEIQIGALPASLTLAANPTLVPKDVPEEGMRIRLSAAVQDDSGAPVNGALVTFVAERGTLDSGSAPQETNQRGIVRDSLRVTKAELAGVSDGFFTVTASTIGDAGAVIEDFVDIEVSGFALNIVLQVIPTSVPETGGTVDLNAIVLDDVGEPAVNAVVVFSTQFGSLASGGGALRTDLTGVARDQLILTAGDLDGAGASFVVTAEVPGAGGGLISDTATITIQRGAPRAIINPTVAITNPGDPDDTRLTFTSESTGDKPLELTWNFGDGTPVVQDVQTGVTRTAIHDYNAKTGVFTVRLTVENNLGIDETELQIDLSTIFP